MTNAYIRFTTLCAGPLQHAVTTRGLQPGQSGPYDAFNLAFHVGDDAENVRANRQRLAKELGFEIEALHAAQQTHEAHAQVVMRTHAARGALDWDSAWPATDALVTCEAATPLLILVADCAPLILVDYQARVLALVHAGWRGATARTASQTVRAMQKLGANPRHIIAGIGPHLCPRCFEIGEEVAVAAAGIEPGAVLRGGAKPNMSLDAVLRADLADAGVTQTETMPLCPRCDNNSFFSHRAQNGTAGRFGLVAWWEA